MDNSIQVHIAAKPIMDGDQGPQVVFGFTHLNFSQAVYLAAPMSPPDAVRAADAFYKGYLEACAAAVKEWTDAQEAGTQAEAGSLQEGSDGAA